MAERNFNLEWLSPTSGCKSNCSFVKETWVRAVGILLHLWSQKVFHEIGEVALSHDGFTYDIPIWVERKTRVEISPELTRKSVGEEDDLNYSLMWLEWKPRSDSYADDTLIFCGTEEDQLKHLRVILVLFEGISGLRINWRKSSLYPINDVANMEALNIILGGQVGFLPTTYFGMPFGNHSRFGIQHPRKPLSRLAQHSNTTTQYHSRNLDTGWDITFRRQSNDWENVRVAEFLNIIGQFSGTQEGEDELWWQGCGKGTFKVSKAYKKFPQPTAYQLAMEEYLEGQIPYKVVCFDWLLSKEAVLSQDNLMKRG
ncbi:hypothetical protein MTR67_026360 [Solanum verrucosum]|uniref:DUF4283 domain-containing protein n=1 Tax=Solanum verrucosum TaxID=315347 RepID=A0AAF0R246_SOLVR|nr:hypothetical protein MTR67_026360 [Solanum verrucosum]